MVLADNGLAPIFLVCSLFIVQTENSTGKPELISGLVIDHASSTWLDIFDAFLYNLCYLMPLGLGYVNQKHENLLTLLRIVVCLRLSRVNPAPQGESIGFLS